MFKTFNLENKLNEIITPKNKSLENPFIKLKKEFQFFNPSENFLGNVERTKEMTFTEADSGNVNPNFEEGEGFQCNCQTCVVVFEARLRGWDIEAKPYVDNSLIEKLSQETNLAWIDNNNKHPDYIFNLNANTTDLMYKFISDTIKPGERYTLQGIWKGPFDYGHIISAFREDTGNLVFYDPQVNRIFNEKSFKEDILSMMKKGTSENETIKLLRIDNLKFDKSIVDDIVKARERYV